jgi:hypothetical protein
MPTPFGLTVAGPSRRSCTLPPQGGAQVAAREGPCCSDKEWSPEPALRRVGRQKTAARPSGATRRRLRDKVFFCWSLRYVSRTSRRASLPALGPKWTLCLVAALREGSGCILSVIFLPFCDLALATTEFLTSAPPKVRNWWWQTLRPSVGPWKPLYWKQDRGTKDPGGSAA